QRIWDAEPCVVTTREEVLASAGSRYTYAANPLAMKEAEKRGLKNLALVGMSCQSSINGTLSARNVNKYRRRIQLVIGLLCSKSFTYDGLTKAITQDYGIPYDDVAKVNIKGRFQMWKKSSGEEVDLTHPTRRRSSPRRRSPRSRCRSRRPSPASLSRRSP